MFDLNRKMFAELPFGEFKVKLIAPEKFGSFRPVKDGKSKVPGVWTNDESYALTFEVVEGDFKGKTFNKFCNVVNVNGEDECFELANLVRDIMKQYGLKVIDSPLVVLKQMSEKPISLWYGETQYRSKVDNSVVTKTEWYGNPNRFVTIEETSSETDELVKKLSV